MSDYKIFMGTCPFQPEIKAGEIKRINGKQVKVVRLSVMEIEYGKRSPPREEKPVLNQRIR